MGRVLLIRQLYLCSSCAPGFVSAVRGKEGPDAKLQQPPGDRDTWTYFWEGTPKK
jgi:hypothetical protein